MAGWLTHLHRVLGVWILNLALAKANRALQTSATAMQGAVHWRYVAEMGPVYKLQMGPVYKLHE